MIFNSYIFILVFLPLSVLGYQIARQKLSSLGKSIYISLVSLFFYCYSETFHGLVFAGILLCNLCCYFIMQYIHRSELRKVLLAIGIAGNLSWLIYYKYYNFMIGTVNNIFHMDLQLRDSRLPIGISFISFHMITFLVDAYRNEIRDFSVRKYFAYFTFYPKLVSGPIVTYNEMQQGERYDDHWRLLAEGLCLFIMGLSKKVLFADQFGNAVDWTWSNLSEVNGLTMILASFMYSLQIYFDFSGYSDMAIGVARMFGYVLPVNFNSPYKAANIAEFWGRWHMTLTNFFTHYLYIPLGGNRKGKIRTYINVMVVFLCSGLWHGASWSFVLWGAIHGALMILHRMLKNRIGRIPHGVKVLFTFLIVNFTWMIFRSGSIGQLRESMRTLIRWEEFSINAEFIHCFDNILFGIVGNQNAIFFVAGALLILALFVVCIFPNTQEIIESGKYLTPQVAIIIILGAFISILSLSNVTNYIYAIF